MKKYETPEIELMLFSTEESITDDPLNPSGGAEPWSLLWDEE